MDPEATMGWTSSLGLTLALVPSSSLAIGSAIFLNS